MLFEPRPVMKPWAKMGCSTPKPAAVPTYMAIESGPWSHRSCFTFSPIPASASSQVMRSKRSPTRRSGCSSRSGEAKMRCCLRPLTQPKPPVATCCGSGRMAVISPPSRVTSRPQSDSQMRQKV